ncbi:hypothetical protein AF395_24105, partial [Salmonella enterica subsp. enterica serovar Typhimurium]
IVGYNWSQSLILDEGLVVDFTQKLGCARGYKAPSLYQTNTNYILYRKGLGSYATGAGTGIGCYKMRNEALKAETSLNKEKG